MISLYLLGPLFWESPHQGLLPYTFTTTDIDHPAYSSPQWTSPHNNATPPITPQLICRELS